MNVQYVYTNFKLKYKVCRKEKRTDSSPSIVYMNV